MILSYTLYHYRFSHIYILLTLLFASDDKLGADIAVGFFLIGGPIALIAGYYADMVNRCVLFGITVMLGSFASGTQLTLLQLTQLTLLQLIMISYIHIHTHI